MAEYLSVQAFCAFGVFCLGLLVALSPYRLLLLTYVRINVHMLVVFIDNRFLEWLFAIISPEVVYEFVFEYLLHVHIYLYAFPVYPQVRVLGMDRSKGVVDVTMDTELVKVRMYLNQVRVVLSFGLWKPEDEKIQHRLSLTIDRRRLCRRARYFSIRSERTSDRSGTP